MTAYEGVAGTPLGHHTELHEREVQLRAMEDLAVAVRAGRGGIARVRGRAGMGKTALLDAWIGRERERGLRVARANGSEMEQTFAFAVVRQLFEPLVNAVDAGERAALLAGPARVAVRALAVGDESLDGLPEFPLLHGLHWLVVNLADAGPLALVVDDVHWADPPSLRFLSYLSRRLDGLPVLLVLATRGEQNDPAGLAAEITAQPNCVTIDVPPLSEAGIARLVRTSMGADAEDAFCLACCRVSEGNPLLATELVRTLVANRVPPRATAAPTVAEFGEHVLARTVVLRLGQESAATWRAAQSLAILGDAASTGLVAELAGLEHAQGTDAIRRLRQLGVVRLDEPSAPLRFSHPLVRTTLVSETLTTAERTDGHQRAAQLLHHEGATRERIASHLLLTPPSGEGWCAGALREAARVAHGRGAPEAAASYLRRALREPLTGPDRASVLTQLGLAEVHFAPNAAAASLQQALALVVDPQATPDPNAPDPEVAARTAATLGGALLLARRGPEAVEVLSQATARLAGVAGGSDRELWLDLEALLLRAAYESLSTVPVALGRAEALRELRLSGETPAERNCLAAQSIYAMAGHESAERTAQIATMAFRGGLELSSTSGLLFPLAALAFVASDRLDVGAAWHAEMDVEAARRSSPLLAGSALYGRAAIAYRIGDVVEALALSRSVLDSSVDFSGYRALPFVSLAANALMDLGELGAAEETLRTYEDLDMADAAWDRGSFLLARGRARLVSGDIPGALTALLDCGRHQDAAHIANPAITPWRSLAALAYAALGEREEAVRLTDEELMLARRWGTPRGIGMALWAIGVITPGAGGIESLAASVDVLEGSPARLELARSLLELGRAQSSAGNVKAGRAHLRRALDLADRCGANGLSERVRVVMRTIGARPRPLPAGSPRILTPSEYRVATMAVQGRTNRDIAQALFVTPRTVEIHLTSTYRKLGLSGRAQLSAALAKGSPQRPATPPSQPG